MHTTKKQLLSLVCNLRNGSKDFDGHWLFTKVIGGNLDITYIVYFYKKRIRLHAKSSNKEVTKASIITLSYKRCATEISLPVFCLVHATINAR